MILGYRGGAGDRGIAGRISRLLSVADGVGADLRVLERAERPDRRVRRRRAGVGGPVPSRIGHYAIERKLGEGGMGVVYAARDERLDRTIALKTLSAPAPRRDGAAAVLARGPRRGQRQPSQRLPDLRDRRGRRPRCSSPWSCSRARRWRSGSSAAPLTAAEALPIGLGVLAALAALHARGIVHRDLKPSNVFLTAARRQAARLRPGPAGAGRRRRPGRRADADRHGHGHAALHVAGAGRRRAGRRCAATCSPPAPSCSRCWPAARRSPAASIVEVLHATRYEQPPALTGSPAVAAVDRVIRRAMAKRPGRSAGVGRRDGRRAARHPRHRERLDAGDGAGADPPRRAAVPRAAPRPRDRLPRLQPARRDRHVAVRQQRR